ncbi:hypothetical protein PCK2_000889 [Pneumocystis canis]|nr:hypothetical protein PCK2_000889 [Pneumocystis canis]
MERVGIEFFFKILTFLEGIERLYEEDGFELNGKKASEKFLEEELRRTELEDLKTCYKEDCYYAAALLGQYAKPGYCEGELTRHCKTLKGMNGRIKEICKDVKKSCEGKGFELQKKQEQLISDLDNQRFGNQERCSKLQVRCLFLEDFSRGVLTHRCENLREHCYLWTRKMLAETIMKNLLKGYLGNENRCINKLQSECRHMGRESPELLDLCLESISTCNKFIKESQRECQRLVEELKREKSRVSEKGCRKWRNTCYRDTLDCPSLKMPCIEMIFFCGERGFFHEPEKKKHYELNEGPPKLLEEMGISTIHSMMKDKGVCVFKPGSCPTPEEVVQFMVKKTYMHNSDCIKALDEKCPSMSYLSYMKGTCTKNRVGSYDVCENLYYRTRNNCDRMFNELKRTGFWSRPDLPLSESECANYISKCYFLTHHLGHWGGYDFCIHIRTVCYHASMHSGAETFLLKKLHGAFKLEEDSKGNKKEKVDISFEKKCVKILLQECGEAMYHNYHVLYKCLRPDETCKNLTNLAKKEADQLNKNIQEMKKKLGLTICEHLMKECSYLEKYSAQLEKACLKLRSDCEEIKKSAKLAAKILIEGDYLKNEEICRSYLQIECGRNTITGNACVFIAQACDSMILHVKEHCNFLFHDLKLRGFDGHNGEIGLEQCSHYQHRCDILGKNCHSTLNHLCQRLRNKCRHIENENKELETFLEKFKGNPMDTNHCKQALKNECQGSEKTRELPILCKNIDQSCERLKENYEQKCFSLGMKLLRLEKGNSKSNEGCNELSPLCKSMGSHCTTLYSSFTTMCTKFETHCQSTKPPAPKPPKPGPGPQPPAPAPKPPAPPQPQPQPGPTPPGPQPAPAPAPPTPAKPEPVSPEETKPEEGEDQDKGKEGEEITAEDKDKEITPEDKVAPKPKPQPEPQPEPEPESPPAPGPAPPIPPAPKPAPPTPPRPRPKPPAPGPTTTASTASTASTTPSKTGRPSILPEEEMKGEGMIKKGSKGYLLIIWIIVSWVGVV